jgi:hypothetical protein
MPSTSDAKKTNAFSVVRTKYAVHKFAYNIRGP